VANTSTGYGGGAPYTVQHLGDAGRYSGDEIPGLVVINSIGATTNSSVNRLVVDLKDNTVEFELTKDLIVNDRLELLTGKLDIAQSAFLDIARNMQWVHGHLVPSADFNTSTVIRFPNESGNTASNISTTASLNRYDLLYVSSQDFTTNSAGNPTAPFEFGADAVRHLTIMAQATANKPITVTLDENKTLTGSLRVVDGTLNLNDKRIKVTGNLAVDAKYNANDFVVTANNNDNARVSGWFPTGREAALNPYNYGTGTHDNGDKVLSNIDHTNGEIEFIGTGNSYVVGYVQASTGSTTAGRGPVNFFKLPNIRNGWRGVIKQQRSRRANHDVHFAAFVPVGACDRPPNHLNLGRLQNFCYRGSEIAGHSEATCCVTLGVQVDN
jgi:small nuclear ribonucleoprotein (snRNP)-like protein